VVQCERIGAVPDAVLVTGDVAFAGDPDEYAYALSWLDELCRGCGTTLSAVFVIPGNHDVVRSIASRTLIQTVHQAIKSTTDIAKATSSRPHREAAKPRVGSDRSGRE
jgi:3',5'-cyclic AMP phosphodiesterase CpdA